MEENADESADECRMREANSAETQAAVCTVMQTGNRLINKRQKTYGNKNGTDMIDRSHNYARRIEHTNQQHETI